MGCYLDYMTGNENETATALDRATVEQCIEAARGEYLNDDTRTPEDEAYNQAVSDVVAAIGALLETGRG